MEFHVSREARDRYGFDKALFAFSGNVIFADLAASRQFAHRINSVREAQNDSVQIVHPGALFAMGLVDELSHAMIEYYRRNLDSKVMTDALAWLRSQLGSQAVEKTLLTFVERFPSSDLYRDSLPVKKFARRWLRGSTQGVSHREVALEEMLLLWLANANPAFTPFEELFSEAPLAEKSGYKAVIGELQAFMKSRPAIGPGKLSLIDMLRAPALASPTSLTDQLAYIRENWAPFLGSALDRIIFAIDVLREEDLAIWMQFHPPVDRDPWRRGAGAYPAVPTYDGAMQEYERFSPDQDWMPSTVLIAKSTFVWLEQLSRKYQRHIHRLDQIPEEELALLAERGLNSLWLIGVWERSTASKTIKQLCGNQDAVASAYSLYDYSIAADLGGEQAYRHLRDRAAAYGIRLASDMVPNHMGIDSSWVIDHPEWFLSRSDSPYPSYRFDGPDLSHDSRVEIKIEDRYYDRSDAAVVFRRRDRWTGEARYVYHGNDGTSFPWNDTAQIDYLNPAAREHVIQTILHVARLFPIIRFDAAMTLAKKHVQRLWYPLPGSGGAIPSRAEYSLTQAQFDAAMPEEFWREVVDRVAREVPGTLLLAEAFWLMEGYFVRTLGMHRVYNSAFMHMLRDEDNAKYRLLMKNTLEFDPEILKRYVNFMSNPDERTAIDQFGKEDKYFGVATLMATMPGLPMFGHGQIEGFTEKYGMEFRTPRYNESPDGGLVARHQRELAPLLHRRWLFAESQDFLLYDFYRPDGSVDENVFAYSNRRGGQRSLVLYHNRYASTSGTLHHSVSYTDKGAGRQVRRSIAEALGLPAEENLILAYRDYATGLEHLQRASRIASHGLSYELHAYQRHVFLDWRELRPDSDHRWDILCDRLGGRGGPSLDDELLSLVLEPAHEALRAMLRVDALQAMASLSNNGGDISGGGEAEAVGPTRAFFHSQEKNGRRFFKEASTQLTRMSEARPVLLADPERMWTTFVELAMGAMRLPWMESLFSAPWPTEAREVLPSASPRVEATAVWGPVMAWCVLRALGAAYDPEHPELPALEVFDLLRLRDPLARAFADLGLRGEDVWRASARVRAAFLPEPETATLLAGLPEDVWRDPDAQWLIGLHEVLDENAGENQEPVRHFFNRELHAQLLWWRPLFRLVEGASKPVKPKPPGQAPPGEALFRPEASEPAQTAAKEPTDRTPKSARRNGGAAWVREIETKISVALEEARLAGYCVENLVAGVLSGKRQLRDRPSPQDE
jgi:glycosidase